MADFYPTNADLPEDVTGVIDDAGASIYRDAFNADYLDNEDEASADEAGWTAVSDAGYEKDDQGNWAKPAAPAAKAPAMPADPKAVPATPAAAAEADLGMSASDKNSLLCQAIDDSLAIADDAQWEARPWVRDIFDAAVVYEYEGASWMSDYTIDAGNVTLGAPTEVRVTYEPVGAAPAADANAPAPAAPGEAAKRGRSGGTARSRRERRRRSEGARSARFDPTSKASLEQLAEAMVSDTAFAVQVAKVAEGLRGDEVGGDFQRFEEQAVRSDGTAYIKLIQPGWGSSGYYSEALLEQDGPTAFDKGTKMYWNHQTEAEEAERPEGDLRNLAGELLEDAVWMAEGPQGAGLYANAKIFSPFQDLVEELTPHMGVSIRAFGKASEGTAEGQDGTLIDSLTYGQSVDFVTEPGAGGKVLELFESATHATKGGRMETKELREAKAAAREANTKLATRDAKDIVTKVLGESELPEASQKRLVEALTDSPALLESGELDETALGEKTATAIETETAYLAELGAGTVRGMGESGAADADAEKLQEALERNLVDIGLDADAAKAGATAR